MSKIKYDKYYTDRELAMYVVEKANEIIGKDNISEFLEPSAGNGVFLDYLPANTLSYDILPEDDRIKKQDFLTLDLDYKQGRCIIGNPPYGERGNLARKFYNKSIELGDYIVFILSIRSLNNLMQNYKFDLIYSEDLGYRYYSNVHLRCCLNIYKRPNGPLNKRPIVKLSDFTLYDNRNKNYNDIKEDFKICRMGSKVWKVLDENENVRHFKVKVHNLEYKNELIKIFNEKYIIDGNNRDIVISIPYISKADVYTYAKQNINGIK